jgi:RHS repeat-associated protein
VRNWTISGLVALVLGLVAPTFAVAQTPLYAPPPQTYSIDARGVDLTTGKYVSTITPVQIGQPGGAGISYSRTYIFNNWRDSVTGTLTFSSGKYYLSIGGTSDVFTLSGSTYTPSRNVGQTLTQSGDILTYTLPDGTTALFSTTLADQNVPLSPTAGNIARITELKRPNGETILFDYDVVFQEIEGLPYFWAQRQSGVSNNYGYALRFSYLAGSPPTNPSEVPDWQKLTGVAAFNLASCASPPSCPSGTDWPSATFSGGNITDQSGRTSFYGPSASGVMAIRSPQNPTVDAIKVNYNTTTSQVTSVVSAGGTWTYAYATASGVLTVTITDPASGVSVAKTTVSTGLLASFKDPLNRETSYIYDANGHVTRVTLPEGNFVSYVYDTRGNVTSTTASPPPPSTETPIVTSATYAATCSNRPTCNQPITTTDARGAVTNYAYDATHGGVTSVTQPAPASGADRPETRIAYAAQTAWISDGAGGYTPIANSITLPVSTSACATGTSCSSAANEVKTTVTYGATGVANNLNPTVVTSGAGDGSLTATTTVAYDTRGDVASVDGPLPGSDDTTTYRYDSARQAVGVIGPDPDGGGPLLRRAVRNTYNADGAVTLAEQGTVNGLTDPDWSAFATLQRQATDYDSYGRPLTARQQDAGGTTLALQQVSYDAAGRTDCTATRMNPGTFAGLPGSTGACSLTAAGAYGPDRIARNTYDAAGQLIATVSGYGTASPITEAATYTPNGQPATLTDGNGNVSTMTYDGFSRLRRLCYPDSGSPCGTATVDYEEYVYDAASNVVSLRNRAGQTITAGYDALNRKVSLGGAVAAHSFAYDNLNRPLYAWTPDGTPIWAVYWGWDALNRNLYEQVAETSAAVTTTVWYGYDAAGRRAYIMWPDGFYANYDWNYGNDLVSIRENGATGWTLASNNYDNLGRRILTTHPNGVGTGYTYDGVSRLASMNQDVAGTGQDVAWTYGYNPAGQIVSRSVSNNAYVYTPANASTGYANNALNQVTALTGTGAATIGYDANQNITTGLGTTYGYDALNELTSAGGAGFAYDPTGRLYQSTSGAATRRYLYDGQQMIGEYDAAGNLISRYVPGQGLDDVTVSYDAYGNRTWLLSDERQSVVALTDGSGSATSINTYDEYGVPGSGNAGRFQYTGQMWLPDAGIYHYRARAYAPQIGRFLQTDPMGYGAGANLYAYVGGDPVNFSDPLGLCTVTKLGWGHPEDGKVLYYTYEYNGCDEAKPSVATDLGNVFVTGTRKPKNGQSMSSNMSDDDRDRAAEDDYAVCRSLSSAAAKARCWASAADRDGARAAGRPVPPLVTGRTFVPVPPAPRASAPNPWVTGGVFVGGAALVCAVVEPCGAAALGVLGLGSLGLLGIQ